MNPESVDYDEKSKKVLVIFTDDSADECLKIILFRNEAWQLHQMIQEKLRYKKE